MVGEIYTINHGSICNLNLTKTVNETILLFFSEGVGEKSKN